MFGLYFWKISVWSDTVCPAYCTFTCQGFQRMESWKTISKTVVSKFLVQCTTDSSQTCSWPTRVAMVKQFLLFSVAPQVTFSLASCQLCVGCGLGTIPSWHRGGVEGVRGLAYGAWGKPAMWGALWRWMNVQSAADCFGTFFLRSLIWFPLVQFKLSDTYTQ